MHEKTSCSYHLLIMTLSMACSWCDLNVTSLTNLHNSPPPLNPQKPWVRILVVLDSETNLSDLPVPVHSLVGLTLLPTPNPRHLCKIFIPSSETLFETGAPPAKVQPPPLREILNNPKVHTTSKDFRPVQNGSWSHFGVEYFFFFVKNVSFFISFSAEIKWVELRVVPNWCSASAISIIIL